MAGRAFVAWAPGQLASALRGQFWRYAESYLNGNPLTVILGDIGGWRAVNVSRGGADPVEDWYILIGYDAGQLVKADLFTSDPGWSGTWANLRSDWVETTADDLIGYYETWMGTWWAGAVAEWTDAADVTLDVSGKTPVEFTLLTFYASLKIETAVGTLACVDQGVVWDSEGIPAEVGSPILNACPPQTAPFAQLAPAVDAGVLERIAKALEDISTQSVDVSINHGASIYSVYGKTISGTED